MNRKLLASLITILIIICAYFYASPYLVLNRIKDAAQAGNSAKVSQYIDYPSVRQSLKDQMKTKMMHEMEQHQNNRFFSWGAKLASAMSDKLIDRAVTPEGMTLMLQGKDLKDSVKGSLHLPSDPSDGTISEGSNQQKYDAAYISMNDFEVTILNQRNKNVKVLMRRDGLSWKIKQIILPLEK